VTGNKITPKIIWREELKGFRSLIAFVISLTVLVDILIFVGMLNKIDWIFYAFAYACSLSPIGVIIILIKEIARKEAI
jgi:uncharacterized protein YebE (UPF0316 family)